LTGTRKLPASTVAAMSPAEVEVRYTVALSQELSDDWRKWFFVSYRQSLGDFDKRCATLRAEARRRELYPLISMLNPFGGLLPAQARLDREIARSQTIEAVRMHAAATGKLPETLAAVSVVPVPADPATGEPFRYRLEGDTATLEAAVPAPTDRDSLRLPVRLRLRGK
jgi:hypothetical protein